jgi:signal transduction histidine kinase
MPPDGKGRPRRASRRLRLGELLALIVSVPLVILLASVAVGILTLTSSAHQRGLLLNRVEPSEAAALRLTTAMVNQETGIRGYQLTAQRQFLAPYELGRRQEQTEIAVLRRANLPGVPALLSEAITRIDAWETLSAQPAIRFQDVVHGTIVTGSIDSSVASKARFDALRTALATLQYAIERQVRAASRGLESSARTTRVTFATIAIVLLLVVLAVGRAVQRLVTRPILRLMAATRRVADGDLGRSIAIEAPLDIEQLAADVDAMRIRLLRELEAANAARGQLAEAAGELERSNTELEQFAYVASHDLQEPLRKVASFCQLLSDRYAGQLDGKADEYIRFAVDGALRMQQLIADLLAFSRVGRSGGQRRPVDLGELARAAAADLQASANATGAEVSIGQLPTLPVETSLMRAVFQNLIANAIKFHGDAPPRVALAARQDGDTWVISCSDNGIGIEPQYAERIFEIFQRLHARSEYPGTGIGLAMCRKIVEYHGGQIWLDPGEHQGTRINFTLPAESRADLPPADPAASAATEPAEPREIAEQVSP